jgi:hypothetical protein
MFADVVCSSLGSNEFICFAGIIPSQISLKDSSYRFPWQLKGIFSNSSYACKIITNILLFLF